MPDIRAAPGGDFRDWYVQAGDAVGNSYAVHFLIPIAEAPNRVGLSYRVALLNSGLGGSTGLKPGDGTAGTITNDDLGRIQRGEVFERVEAVATHPGETWEEFQTAISKWYAEAADDVAQEIESRLAYFGGAGNVV